jgi:O-methyltransferase
MNIALKGLKLVLRKTSLLPTFYHIVNRVRPSFSSLHPDNLGAIIQAMQEAPRGDYYEFGVYKGFSFWFATQIATALKRTDMRFFGFDSFDGLPKPKGVDTLPDASGNTFARGCFCAGLELVRSYLTQYRADMEKVQLIPGFFSDVLNPSLVTQYNMQPASVVLIDCDMYQSTRDVLVFLPNILQVGSIVLFDDWLLTDENKGQRLAFRQWQESNSGFIMKDFCEFAGGKGFQVTAIPNKLPNCS